MEAECFFVAALFVLCLISGLHIYYTRVNKFLPRERVSCFSDSCCFYAMWKFARGEKEEAQVEVITLTMWAARGDGETVAPEGQ